jgi:hypothetical protein
MKFIARKTAQFNTKTKLKTNNKNQISIDLYLCLPCIFFSFLFQKK